MAETLKSGQLVQQFKKKNYCVSSTVECSIQIQVTAFE